MTAGGADHEMFRECDGRDADRDPAALAAEIEALDQATTPGPWRTSMWMEDSPSARLLGPHGETIARFSNVREEGPQNLELAARARTLLPEAAATIRALMAENVKLHEANADLAYGALEPLSDEDMRRIFGSENVDAEAQIASFVARHAIEDVRLQAENAKLRALIAECLAFNPTMCGSMVTVAKWADVLRRMREEARGTDPGEAFIPKS